MPYVIVKEDNTWCVHKENVDGSAGEKIDCHPTEEDARRHMAALYSAMEAERKAILANGGSIKAVGDWELDVLAIPFNSVDADGQWFDENTDIKPETFNTPLVAYQHGINPGAKSIQDKIIEPGKSVQGSLKKMTDGWHLRVILDKTIELAKKMMEAGKKGLLAVSSGSIYHLARLEVDGKIIPYSKDTPGRIAIWPFAEISIWDKGNGNFQPANHFAVALPAMKAIYEEAGIPFPVINSENDEPKAEEKAAKIARKNLQKQARQLISTFDEE